MNHSHMISRLDESRVLGAICAAETKTTAPIRVMVSRHGFPDALPAARMHFKILKLEKSPQRNAVLIFIAPKSQTFAIYGDAATHASLGPDFWNTLRDQMADHLKESRFTDALVHAIAKAGDILSEHFPRETTTPPSRQD